MKCSFLSAVSLIKETAHFITHPDAVYNSSADAILIQSRCIKSVVSLEKSFASWDLFTLLFQISLTISHSKFPVISFIVVTVIYHINLLIFLSKLVSKASFTMSDLILLKVLLSISMRNSSERVHKNVLAIKFY